jgi:tRNA dimethylallyltransferase
MGSVWLIAGPTASGKSALALALARARGAEIVNADSMQLYRDLPILTARPGAEEEAQAPHHLFGVADAADGWSVGRWLSAATEVLREIAGRGRPAVIVGGTGLYFNALTKGLAEIPPIPDHARQLAEARYDHEGEEGVRAALRRLDPESEARINPNDRQRLVRALEVAEGTGISLTAWQRGTRPALVRYRPIVLEPPREALYARCDARLAKMVEAGALEEAKALLARGLDPKLPLMKAVGLRELGRYLAGEIGLDAAIAEARQETRNYAKRQSTWFRNQSPYWPRLDEFGEAVDVSTFGDTWGSVEETR